MQKRVELGGARERGAVTTRSLGASIAGLLGCLCALAVFSVLAAKPALAAECSNAAFRTGASANLPDCRAYEQVSPVDKNGGDVTPNAFGGAQVIGGGGQSAGIRANSQIWQVSTDGEAAEYTSRAAFSGSLGGLPLNPYVARRSAAGWASRGITPPMNPAPILPGFSIPNFQYVAFSPDLSVGVLSDIDASGPVLAAGAVPGYPNLYLRDTATDAYTALSNVPPPNITPFPTSQSWNAYKLRFQGASADYSHVVFTAPEKLTPDAQVPCGSCQQLYEWVDGRLRSVNYLPNQTTTTADATAGTTVIHGAPNRDALVSGAVSEDGSKVYWSDYSGGTTPPPVPNIYVRVDGTETVPVGSGTFWAATPDGEHALYQSGSVRSGGDLYEFDLASGRSTDLTPAGLVQGVVGASRDLSYVYFVAKAALAPGAVNGGKNLYLDHAGSISLIATLPSSEGEPDSSFISIDTVSPSHHIAYVTPSGRDLAFTSAGELTGYSTVPSEPSACSGLCTEVFHYDADTATLTCVSCDVSGKAPDGPAAVLAWQNQNYDPISISADGAHVFFESWDDLVPADVNDQQDVYEWEPPGAGDCAAANGCQHLISSGTGGVSDSGGANPPLNDFVGASADGSNVFITTVQPLVPTDTDELSDLYDVRVDGGLADQHMTPASPCTGDACLAPPSPPASQASPGSADFSGPGSQVHSAKKKHKKGCMRIHNKRKRHRCLVKHRKHHKHRQHRKHSQDHKHSQHRTDRQHHRRAK
jgi:hypothetical protein